MQRFVHRNNKRCSIIGISAPTSSTDTRLEIQNGNRDKVRNDRLKIRLKSILRTTLNLHSTYYLSQREVAKANTCAHSASTMPRARPCRHILLRVTSGAVELGCALRVTRVSSALGRSPADGRRGEESRCEVIDTRTYEIIVHFWVVNVSAMDF